MGVLNSQKFAGVDQLEKAAVIDSEHVGEDFHPRGDHVKRIQEALVEVGVASQIEDPVGFFKKKTGDAVETFKKQRNIRNFAGKIDRIVGKKTIAELDKLLPQRESVTPKLIPTTATKFVDFVIRFRGGNFRTATEGLDLTEHKKKTKRRLHAISKRASIGDAELIDKTIEEIDGQLKNTSEARGIICIWGNSAGGRNVIELAAKLVGKHPVKFLGIADAALFQDIGGMNRPIPAPTVPFGRKDLRAINNPVWTSPKVDADIKHNFFQTSENRVGGSLSNLVWTSENKGEVHGEVFGFQVNEKISIPVSVNLAGTAHDFAGDEGDKRNSATISSLLGNLADKSPSVSS